MYIDGEIGRVVFIDMCTHVDQLYGSMLGRVDPLNNPTDETVAYFEITASHLILAMMLWLREDISQRLLVIDPSQPYIYLWREYLQMRIKSRMLFFDFLNVMTRSI